MNTRNMPPFKRASVQHDARAQRQTMPDHAKSCQDAFANSGSILNFDQIKVGDKVKATMVEEFAVSMAAPGALSNPTNRVTVLRAPNGVDQGPKPVDTVRFTAKVLAFDYILHQVTLQLGDGTTRTVQVRERVNLANYNVGDTVSVLITEAMTIGLEKQ